MLGFNHFDSEFPTRTERDYVSSTSNTYQEYNSHPNKEIEMKIIYLR